MFVRAVTVALLCAVTGCSGPDSATGANVADARTDADGDTPTDATTADGAVDAGTDTVVTTDAATDTVVTTDAATDAVVTTDAATDAVVTTDAATDTVVTTDAATDAVAEVPPDTGIDAPAPADVWVGCDGDGSCDDGLWCNGVETCDGTLGCRPGVAPPVDDGVACTADTCDEVSDAIVHTPDDAACDDGLWCNGPERCDAVLDCQAGPAPAVDDGVPCTLDGCDEATDSIVHAPNDAACDDSLWCNGSERCDATLDCQAGAAPAVDDALTCTLDSCDEAIDSIVHAPIDAGCDDGLWCNGPEGCDATLGCRPGIAPPLSDGVACTVDSCDEATDSIVHTPDDVPCDDGLWCNGPERCDVTFGCWPGVAPPRGDGVPCTVDSCDETTDSIVHTPNDAACADANVCDGDDWCDVTLGCQPGVSAPAGTSCEGQLSCRTGETCDGAGACSPTSGTGLVCPDPGDVCRDPTCSEGGGGCTTTPHLFSVTGNVTMRGIDNCFMNQDFALSGMACSAWRDVAFCYRTTATCIITSTGAVQARLHYITDRFGSAVTSGCSSVSVSSALAAPTTLSCCI